MYVRYENRELTFDSFLRENFSFYSHIHQQVELVYVHGGEVLVTVDDQEQLLQENELAIVFPNTVHSYRSNANSQVFLLIFSMAMVSEYEKALTMTRPQNPFLVEEQIHEDIPCVLRSLGLDRECCSSKRLRKGYLLVLLGRIIERLELVQVTTGEDVNLIRRLLVFMNEHFRENISLDQVAQELQVSKFHLSRCFSQKIGCNFNEYINALRVQYAENLLMTSHLSITDISFEVGFEGISTFYRAFWKNYGESPGQYRKRLQQ